jgi:hypothetical protein
MQGGAVPELAQWLNIVKGTGAASLIFLSPLGTKVATTTPEVMSIQNSSLGRTFPHVPLLVFDFKKTITEPLNRLALLFQDAFSCP